MKIKDFLNAKAVSVDLQGTTKEEIIDEMVNLLIKSGAIDRKNKAKLTEVLLARETLGSTAIGQGIADAPALAAADVGVALRAADDVALEAAGVLVFGPDPRTLSGLIALARSVRAASRGALVLALIPSLSMILIHSLLAARGNPLPVYWAGGAAVFSTLAATALARKFRRRRILADSGEPTTPSKPLPAK